MGGLECRIVPVRMTPMSANDLITIIAAVAAMLLGLVVGLRVTVTASRIFLAILLFAVGIFAAAMVTAAPLARAPTGDSPGLIIFWIYAIFTFACGLTCMLRQPMRRSGLILVGVSLLPFPIVGLSVLLSKVMG